MRLTQTHTIQTQLLYQYNDTHPDQASEHSSDTIVSEFQWEKVPILEK